MGFKDLKLLKEKENFFIFFNYSKVIILII